MAGDYTISFEVDVTIEKMKVVNYTQDEHLEIILDLETAKKLKEILERAEERFLESEQ